MVTILARVTVHPGTTEGFETLARELYARSHAGEPRLQRYEYARSSEERTYYTLMSFDSYEGFLEHQASPHHIETAPALREMIESISLEWLDPLPAASPLHPCDRTPPELDELPELLRDHAARHPLRIPAWWP